jgi:hypothetical protein
MAGAASANIATINFGRLNLIVLFTAPLTWWLRPFLMLRAIALALRVGLAFAAAHALTKKLAAFYHRAI